MGRRPLVEARSPYPRGDYGTSPTRVVDRACRPIIARQPPGQALVDDDQCFEILAALADLEIDAVWICPHGVLSRGGAGRSWCGVGGGKDVAAGSSEPRVRPCGRTPRAGGGAGRKRKTVVARQTADLPGHLVSPAVRATGAARGEGVRDYGPKAGLARWPRSGPRDRDYGQASRASCSRPRSKHGRDIDRGNFGAPQRPMRRRGEFHRAHPPQRGEGNFPSVLREIGDLRKNGVEVWVLGTLLRSRLHAREQSLGIRGSPRIWAAQDGPGSTISSRGGKRP